MLLVITILYTFKLKAPGSNPLNNSRWLGISQFALASVFIMIILCLEDSNQMVKITMKKLSQKQIRTSVFQSGCPGCYH